jgi:hypothetical protein
MTTHTQPPQIPQIPLPKYPQQDQRLHAFLTLLLQNNQEVTTRTKPTVHPSLTRRILHRQGVGYTDPLVGTIISIASDRFLATILSQALVCRDRRIKGDELKRKEQRERERGVKRQRAWKEGMEVKRRRLQQELEDFVKKASGGGGGGGGGGKGVPRQEKKISNELVSLLQTNRLEEELGGNKRDCVQEEEEYYNDDKGKNGDDMYNPDQRQSQQQQQQQQPYEEDDEDQEQEEEDEEEDILLLKDLVRPLRAWGMSSLAAKAGLASDILVNVSKHDGNEQQQDKTNMKQNNGELDDDDDDNDDEGGGGMDGDGTNSMVMEDDLEDPEDMASPSRSVVGDKGTPMRRKKKMMKGVASAAVEKGGSPSATPGGKTGGNGRKSPMPKK